MELSLLALALVLTAIFAVGVVAFTLMLGCLCYGRYYWDRGEFKGHRMSRRCRQWPLWHWIVAKCDHTIVWVHGAEDSNVQCIYATGPHGILVASGAFTFLPERGYFRRPVRLAIHSLLLSVFFIRDMLLALGCVDVSRDGILRALGRGESVAVVKDGVLGIGVPVKPLPEVPPCVKLAWEFDYPVRAVFYGGEEELYWVWKERWGFITWLRYVVYCLIRYPPTVWLPRFLWARQRPPLTTYIGPLLYPKRTEGQSLEAFGALFAAEYARLERLSRKT